MQSTLVILDLGPAEGWAGRVDDRMVCIAPPATQQDPDARRRFLEAVRDAGGDCEACNGCILARAN